MTELQRRIARARLLRRDGKTYDEIRAVVGPVSDDRLQTWLVGIPRPRATWRTHRLTELRRESRRLRALGLTYTEIAAKTGAAEGSVSLWVRDVRRPNRERVEAKRLEALRRASTDRSALAKRRRDTHSRIAAASIGPIDAATLFVLGIGLYWAEGSKSKPYALRERVAFVNGDSTMIEVFMTWLTLVGVRLEDCRFRLSIHESADVLAAETYWASVLGVPVSSLARTTLKRHLPKTNRLNVGEGYHGCLVISVMKSARLYRSIAGWWAGMHAQLLKEVSRSPDWSETPPWRGWQAYTHPEA